MISPGVDSNCGDKLILQTMHVKLACSVYMYNLHVHVHVCDCKYVKRITCTCTIIYDTPHLSMLCIFSDFTQKYLLNLV